MSLTTDPNCPEPDKGVAIHEVGHALAFADAGIPLISVEVLGDGGYTYVKDDPDPVTKGFMVGLMAGVTAETIWLQRETGLGRREALNIALESGNHSDIDAYETYNRTVRLYREDAISAAEKLLRREWRRLEELAEELYLTQHLSGARF